MRRRIRQDPATNGAGSGSSVAGSGFTEYGLSNTTWFSGFAAGYRVIRAFSAALQQKRVVLSITLVPGIPGIPVFPVFPCSRRQPGHCTFGVSLLLLEAKPA